LCLRCGTCCHKKVVGPEGVFFIHPTAKCEHLDEKNSCLVYEERTCLRIEAMVAQDGVLPAHCPYTRLRPGYLPGRMVTEGEFEEWISELQQIKRRIEEGMNLLCEAKKRDLDGSR
ncbi:MAG TPA: hypothetical protein V6C82_08940, partial [Chroococcales cyanobacterium]